MNQEVKKRVEVLAIMVLHLLTRKGIANFPGTTRGSPSTIVVVELAFGQPLRPGDRKYFPIVVPWNVWQEVIVPLLKGESPYGIDFLYPYLGIGWGPGQNENNVRMLDPEWEVLIARLVQAIGSLMEDRGFIPKGSITG